jgi:hypothetical protein
MLSRLVGRNDAEMKLSKQSLRVGVRHTTFTTSISLKVMKLTAGARLVVFYLLLRERHETWSRQDIVPLCGNHHGEGSEMRGVGLSILGLLRELKGTMKS